MKKTFTVLVLSISNLLIISCQKDNEFDPARMIGAEANTNQSVNQWIYGMMCRWYLWNDQVKDLTPDMTLEPEHFFLSLLSAENGDGKHDSYYSYIEREPVGIRTSQSLDPGFGFEFGLVLTGICSGGHTRERVFAVVTYVWEGSPAWKAGLRRGHYIGEVNGESLNSYNYGELYPLLLPKSYTGNAVLPVTVTWYELGWAEDDPSHPCRGCGLVDIRHRESSTLYPANIEYNPIHTYDIIELADGLRVGYVHYIAFDRGDGNVYDDALKRLFARFRQEGIRELVLDLRYNGGGYVTTAQLMASMIVPHGLQGTTYEQLRFNDEIMSAYGRDGFQVKIPFLTQAQMQGDNYGTRSAGTILGLERVYVLATDCTASASESLINCLRGVDVDVVHIGTRTEGKNVGMHCIGYDNGFGGVFDGYKYTLWPVAFACANARGESDYAGGFEPQFRCDEYEFVEWGQLGDPGEPLLAAALFHIRNGSFPAQSRSATSPDAGVRRIEDLNSVKFTRRGQRMAGQLIS